MKIIFMGTPDFAVPTLEEIIKAGHEVIAVVTQPDKPKGRGKQMQFPPIKEVAIKHDIPVYQPVKVRVPEFIEVLTNLEPELIVVAAFGQILPKVILDLPKFGCINVHASLLPRYRGAAPIQWAVINGEKEAGVTIMHMDVGLDTGDMISKASILVSEDETGGSLFDKISALGAKLLVETLPTIEDGTAKRVKQNDEESNYAPMLKKDLGDIDWTQKAEVLERLIRGLNPWPSAYTMVDGKMFKIWKASVVDKNVEGTLPGTVIDVMQDSILVQTGDKCLALYEVQLEGKKRMEVATFLLGYSIEKNTVLGKA